MSLISTLIYDERTQTYFTEGDIPSLLPSYSFDMEVALPEAKHVKTETWASQNQGSLVSLLANNYVICGSLFACFYFETALPIIVPFNRHSIGDF
jgi:hypothetical protein